MVKYFDYTWPSVDSPGDQHSKFFLHSYSINIKCSPPGRCNIERVGKCRGDGAWILFLLLQQKVLWSCVVITVRDKEVVLVRVKEEREGDCQWAERRRERVCLKKGPFQLPSYFSCLILHPLLLCPLGIEHVGWLARHRDMWKRARRRLSIDTSIFMTRSNKSPWFFTLSFHFLRFTMAMYSNWQLRRVEDSWGLAEAYIRVSTWTGGPIPKRFWDWSQWQDGVLKQCAITTKGQ